MNTRLGLKNPTLASMTSANFDNCDVISNTLIIILIPKAKMIQIGDSTVTVAYLGVLSLR